MAGFPTYAAGFPHHYAPVTYLPTAVPTSVPAITPVGHWVKHTSHDGRTYYYNSVTQQTTWEKPQELKSTRELLLSNCPWKEFKSDTGKVYYYNEHTKQSVWEKPQELIEAESQADCLAPAPPPETTETSFSQIGTPFTPATPMDDQGKPPEPSAIEKAMMATLASYEVPPTPADSIPVPPPLPTESSVESRNENAAEEAEKPLPAQHGSLSPAPIQEYKTRGEMAEGLRRLFRDCNVPGGATWEQALKLISADPRYNLLKSFNEKKQIFNVYKTQKLKEEREEQRLRAKQAKENLERFLLKHPKLHSTMSYRKVDQLLADAREWTVVPDRDRRELFDDVMQLISKREREEAKILRKRNIKVFNEILADMPNLTFRTTWSEAQQMLLDNSRFTGDIELQSLDKEDALVCFEEHICMLEQEHDEEKERERRKQKRLQRKNREAFLVLLEELHDHKLLTSTSMWKDLYPIISKDDRFHKMLAQRGSTPLDLFKFFVEALKARYPAERKLIKEIVRDCGFSVDLHTTFEEFESVINQDERSKGIDIGNLRMSFDNFVEKAHGRERERQRDDARRIRKLEQNFCEMLCSADFIGPSTTWEEVRDHFQSHAAFKALSLESERIRLFKDHLISLDSAQRDTDKSHRSSKEKHRHKHEIRESSDRGQKSEKKMKSVSPTSESSTVRNSEGEGDADSGRHHKSHRKSKKSKHKKSKHRKHHKSRQPGDEELEEGEAADDDEDEDESTGAGPKPTSSSSAREGHSRHKKHKSRVRSSDPEDGEEVDSASDEDEAYERVSKRKRH